MRRCLGGAVCSLSMLVAAPAVCADAVPAREHLVVDIAEKTIRLQDYRASAAVKLAGHPARRSSLCVSGQMSAAGGDPRVWPAQ